MRNVLSVWLTLALAGSLLAQNPPAAAPKPAPAQPAATPAAAGDPVVLTIGTEKITQSEFERIMEQAIPPEQRSASLTPAGRRAIAEQLAELKVLAQQARSQKLDQTPEARTQLAMRTDQFTASLLFRKIQEGITPDEAAVVAYYNEHKQEWDTVTARHILIRMKGSAVPLKEGQADLSDEEALAKAKDLRAKIAAGGSFEELAKVESDDRGSGTNGGALGDFTRGRMVPQFEETAFTLKENELSEPVKTQFGYHLIQVQKHTTKSLNEVSDDIKKKLVPELTQKGIDEVKAKTAISFDTNYFGK